MLTSVDNFLKYREIKKFLYLIIELILMDLEDLMSTTLLCMNLVIYCDMCLKVM